MMNRSRACALLGSLVATVPACGSGRISNAHQTDIGAEGGAVGGASAVVVSGGAAGSAGSGAGGKKASGSVTAAVVPSAISVKPGGTGDFVATVSGASNQSVSWAVTESGGGSVDASGHYAAPQSEGTYHVVATSVAAPSVSATATVTVTPNPVATFSLSPKTAKAAFSGTVQFSVVVTGIADTTVKWAVTEGDGGTVNARGLYSAPSTSGVFHVVATSNGDPTKQDTATITVSAPAGTPPVLKPGTWVNISPNVTLTGVPSFGVNGVAFDPSNRDVLYLTIDVLGMWKTTDRGSNWVKMGDPNKMGNPVTSYLDSPFRVAVDPGDSSHLYATQGVRGATIGFWVSHDGGDTWTMPQGFEDFAKTVGNNVQAHDVTTLTIDPLDFKHFLLGYHSGWSAGNAGVLESKDGGVTFIPHKAVSSWPTGTMGIGILFDPEQGVGNAQTWLVTTDGNGFWRTEDSGDTWTQVATYGIPHGGAQMYYGKNKTVYNGSSPYPLRSKDNGATWEQCQNGVCMGTGRTSSHRSPIPVTMPGRARNLSCRRRSPMV